MNNKILIVVLSFCILGTWFIVHLYRQYVLTNPNVKTEQVFRGEPAGPYKLNTELEKTKAAASVPTSGKYFALLIGNTNYSDPHLRNLNNPILDAERLFRTLNRCYKFDSVSLLRNVSRDDFYAALNYWSTKLGGEDNFLLFYAGHGEYDTTIKVGYWLPIDARHDSSSKWLTLPTDVVGLLSKIHCKHKLVIADACFAGNIFRVSRSAQDDDNLKPLEILYSENSFTAMTSCMNTKVPDNSQFIEGLIETLKNNSEKLVSARTIFNRFSEKTLSASRRNIPQYGTVQPLGNSAENEFGGDFIFIKK